jgi:hypothetical protein
LNYSTDLPREPLRRQLAALGIARERHSMQSLVEMLPATVEGLDADSVAEVLVHLVGRGLIAVPAPEASELTLRWGERHCYCHRDEDELLSLLLPYFRQGLAEGERCLWLPDAPAPHVEFAVATLGAGEYSPDQLEILRPGEWRNELGFWMREEERALGEGYAGLRICGEDLELAKDTAPLRIKALCTSRNEGRYPATLANEHGHWRRAGSR